MALELFNTNPFGEEKKDSGESGIDGLLPWIPAEADGNEDASDTGYKVRDFRFKPPLGIWDGKLIGKGFDKSNNLILYFVRTGTDEKYRLTAFPSVKDKSKYTARDGVIDFNMEAIEGAIYTLSTGNNSKEKPAFYSALLRDKNGAE